VGKKVLSSLQIYLPGEDEREGKKVRELVYILMALFFSITGAAVWQSFVEHAASGKPF